MVTSAPCFPFYPTVSVSQIFRWVDPTTIYQICLSHNIPQSKLVPQHLHTGPSFMTLLTDIYDTHNIEHRTEPFSH